MKEMKCTIIQDILPLYIDGVVSSDTKELVDEHLQRCEKCQKEYESMKQVLYLPVENKPSLFRNMSKKWRKKKVMISLGSILATAAILMGTFLYVFYYEKVIPYSENLIKIERQNDDQLVSHYFGESYATLYMTHPMKLQIDGETKKVSFIYYTKTIADSPTRNLINDEKMPNGQGYLFELPEGNKTDAVYYAEYDTVKSVVGTDYWDTVLERAVLIWEK